jgi:hypothetical protein
MKRCVGAVVLALVVAAPAFAADMPLLLPVYKELPRPLFFGWISWYSYGWDAGAYLNSPIDPFDFSGFSDVVNQAGGYVFAGLSPNGFVSDQVNYDWQKGGWSRN